MKVLLLNGSPKPRGCTYTALERVAQALEEEGIQTEILHVGGKNYGGCTGCGNCGKNGRCIYEDGVNRAAALLDEADGVVFGSPVHYAAPSATMMGVMHRLAISAGAKLRHKPAACVVSARRGGTTAALEVLNKVPQFLEMPLVSSQYWPMVHGSNPQQVQQDQEGLQIMDRLGRNMAWMLKCIQAGKEAGVNPPAPRPTVRTDFYKEL